MKYLVCSDIYCLIFRKGGKLIFIKVTFIYKSKVSWKIVVTIQYIWHKKAVATILHSTVNVLLYSECTAWPLTFTLTLQPTNPIPTDTDTPDAPSTFVNKTSVTKTPISPTSKVGSYLTVTKTPISPTSKISSYLTVTKTPISPTSKVGSYLQIVVFALY